MRIEQYNENSMEEISYNWVILVEDALAISNLNLPEEIRDLVHTFLDKESLKIAYGKIQTFQVVVHHKVQMITLAGIGAKPLNVEQYRFLAGNIIRHCTSQRTMKTIVIVPEKWKSGTYDSLEAFLEGLFLGNYTFNAYKTKYDASVNVNEIELYWPGINESDFTRSLQFAQTLAESISLTRNWVNTPANDLTPTDLAHEAEKIAQETGLNVSVFDKQGIEKIGMTSFLTVAKGSEEEPKLIVCRYEGHPNDQEWVAYIGKGITFDSGGISLKSSQGMGDMKDDMAGAATVLAAMRAIALLKPNINIMAVIPCTENMPSGKAYRPGDVIKSMNGKTIEVISTDAEGRLILADAITYAKQLGATKLIDIATLTGACVVALGSVTSGVMGNDEIWAEQVLKAAKQCGEKMWQLPLFDEYSELIKSDIADLKNSGGREAGAITAGCFLKAFAEETPWVHIDIAGTVTSSKSKGDLSKGATGVGVRTLVNLAQRQS